MANFAKTIRIFLIDGAPSGRWSCEMSNWTGKAYKIPRNKVLKCDDRPDLASAAVYFLFGRDENDNELIYIGESENGIGRIKDHMPTKDYWSECVIFISKDDYLNKAHIKYMEHRFYQMATEAKRFKIMNTTVPTTSSISEADQAECEEFIHNARLMVNLLGFKAFEALAEKTGNDEEILYLSAAGLSASGKRTSEGFVVFAGSSVAKSILRRC